MLLYKRFLFIFLIISIISYAISVMFVDNIFLKIAVFILILAILYLLIFVIPYRYRSKFALFNKYISWIESSAFRPKDKK